MALQKYDVIIELSAASNIDDVFYYIAHVLREPDIAERICGSIQAAIASLQNFPMRHAIIAEEPFASKEIRPLSVENYTIFYAVDDAAKEVHVLHVVYSRREWKNLF